MRRLIVLAVVSLLCAAVWVGSASSSLTGRCWQRTGTSSSLYASTSPSGAGVVHARYRNESGGAGQWWQLFWNGSRWARTGVPSPWLNLYVYIEFRHTYGGVYYYLNSAYKWMPGNDPPCG